MVRLNDSLKGILGNLFSFRIYNSDNYCRYDIEDMNNHSKGIIIDINQDVIEVPIVGIQYFVSRISEFTNNLGSKFTFPLNCIVPLLYNDVHLAKKTFDSIARYFLSKSAINNYNMVRIVANNNTYYYGNRGIILNGDKEPLMLATIKVRRITTPSLTYNYIPIRYVIHINPKVFTEFEDVVSKGIIKKLIPYYLSTSLSTYNCLNPYEDIEMESTIAEIVLDDIDKFFINPIEYIDKGCDINEEINNFLNSNVSEVLDNIKV